MFIPGLSWDGQSIPGIPGYSDKVGRGTCRTALSIPGRPGMVRVSQESQDTQTRWVEVGQLYPSRDCPGMVRVSQESRDTQTRGVEVAELYPSRDCPGMVRVSQESRDTQTRGVEVVELYPSRDCPGMVRSISIV